MGDRKIEWGVYDPNADLRESHRNLPHRDQAGALTFVRGFAGSGLVFGFHKPENRNPSLTPTQFPDWAKVRYLYTKFASLGKKRGRVNQCAAFPFLVRLNWKFEN